MSTQAENHSNFVDIWKHMKNLENHFNFVERKYDYATLAEWFDIVDDLTDWDEKTKRTTPEPDYPGKLTE